MTYPMKLYPDGDGEVSARFRLADTEPDLVRSSGTSVHYLATGASTEELFGLYKWVMGPEPGGAEPHFHRTFFESFFVLSGTIEFFDGDGWEGAGVGAFVHVPPGGVHAFRNRSGAPASMLIHFARGAPREAYFERLDELADLSDDERDEFFRAHDNLWVD